MIPQGILHTRAFEEANLTNAGKVNIQLFFDVQIWMVRIICTFVIRSRRYIFLLLKQVRKIFSYLDAASSSCHFTGANVIETNTFSANK